MQVDFLYFFYSESTILHTNKKRLLGSGFYEYTSHRFFIMNQFNKFYNNCFKLVYFISRKWD